MAQYRECKVKFNRYLLETYKDKFIEDTVAHEMAHLFAHDSNPNCAAHGSDWYYMMFMLGAKASRCHDMETKPARQSRKWNYTCKCGKDFKVSTIKHNRIQNGTVYRCASCKTRLWRD